MRTCESARVRQSISGLVALCLFVPIIVAAQRPRVSWFQPEGLCNPDPTSNASRLGVNYYVYALTH